MMFLKDLEYKPMPSEIRKKLIADYLKCTKDYDKKNNRQIGAMKRALKDVSDETIFKLYFSSVPTGGKSKVLKYRSYMIKPDGTKEPFEPIEYEYSSDGRFLEEKGYDGLATFFIHPTGSESDVYLLFKDGSYVKRTYLKGKTAEHYMYWLSGKIGEDFETNGFVYGTNEWFISYMYNIYVEKLKKEMGIE